MIHQLLVLVVVLAATETTCALQSVSLPFKAAAGGLLNKQTSPVEKFFEAWNRQEVDTAIAQFSNDCEYEDASHYAPFSKSQLKRQLLLRMDSTKEPIQYVMDDMVVSEDKVGVKYHLEISGNEVPDSRHCAFYTVNVTTGLIQSCFDVCEPRLKTGELDLAVLSVASKIIGSGSEKSTGVSGSNINTPPSVAEKENTGFLGSLFSNAATKENRKDAATLTPPERYFDAWNRRDMEDAVNVFTKDCYYTDTVFPQPFSGKEKLKAHLLTCSDAFPSSFQFVVDDIANGGGDTIATRWHVENDGKQMPFTRGVSFYKVDGNLISEGFDEVEPAVFKLGGLNLFLTSVKTKLLAEPVRFVPLVLWIAYMYIVFFSIGILPGANALQLEQRTWEEVRDLSLNFFLVAPLLDLPFSPTVHPILEGVFNLLLSWAALFAGFFSDERDDKPNLLPMLPTVVGMQFLTSAFLLPYLATRTSEKANVTVSMQDLNTPARLVESPSLGLLLGAVGTGSIVWGTVARAADFGGWGERVASFWQLMSIDRVGSSFLVDLAIFALFQGWLVDEDMKRRGMDQNALLGNVAKFIPFFGMAAYMILRPSFPEND